MKRALTLLALALTLALGSSDAYAQKAKAKGKARGKAAKAAVQVSPEMKDFMSRLDVDGKKTTAALAAFKAKDAETSDMSGDLSVANPRILKVEKKGDEEQYTMFAQTAEARRTFLIVWKDKKIQRIKQLSMEF
jgi:type IV secretory pathway VirJ component